jgi:hypothetical protein
MPNINVGLNVQVEGGPQVPVPPIKLNIEAYDKVEISVAPGDEVSVDIQPGDQGVSFLLIKSSVYTPPDAAKDKKLTYEPEGKSAISLSTPQIFLGADSIATLLGSVKKIKFSNKLEVATTPATPAVPATPPPAVPAIPAPPAVIEILVGRDATPPPTVPATPPVP